MIKVALSRFRSRPTTEALIPHQRQGGDEAVSAAPPRPSDGPSGLHEQALRAHSVAPEADETVEPAGPAAFVHDSFRAQTRAVLAALPMSVAREWRLDPTRHALELSRWRTDLPGPICDELGRRLLLLHLEMSQWVLRRVEKVSFERDRSIGRTIAVDLLIPVDAPRVVDDDGTHYWLVPLSVMRRRTIVNFDLRDEQGHRLTTPGLRLTQQLDQSVLQASARAVSFTDTEREEFDRLTTLFIGGERSDVLDVEDALEAEKTDLLRKLGDDETFMSTFDRLRRGFTLYVFLPVASGRHRLLTMAFDEPTGWMYQRPRLDRPDGRTPDPVCRYEPGSPVRGSDWRRVAATLGWRPTRIRFQVPSAEAAASYHFEVTAPPGVRLEKATLVAGRPNEQVGGPDDEPPTSVDRIEGHAPTLGLHAVEVPNGSLCRVQLDLGIPTRGWLTTMLASSWIILCVLGLVALPWTMDAELWEDGQVRDLVLVLATTAAGIAALVAHNDFGEVATRLVAPIRVFSAIAVTLPVLQAGVLVFAPSPATGGDSWGWAEYVEWGILAVAFVIVLVMTPAWMRSRISEKADAVRSPWDMTVPRPEHECVPRVPRSFWGAVDQYRFDSPAVGVQSAEAWRERFRWTDRRQRHAIETLQLPTDTSRSVPRALRCPREGAGCPRSAGCPD
jgi:hypothetical protein